METQDPIDQGMEQTLSTLSRVMGADNANYLSSKAIYSLNRVLQELLDDLGIAPPSCAPDQGRQEWVVPYLFDHHKRSWHFACVLRQVWDGSVSNDEKQEVLLDVLWLLTKIALDGKVKQEFPYAKEHLLEGRDYAMAYTRVTDEVGRIVEHLESCGSCRLLKSTWSDGSSEAETKAFAQFKGNSTECVKECLRIKVNGSEEGNSKTANELVRAVMWVYHALRNHRGTYIPGIFYRGLRNQSSGILDRFEGKQQEGSLNVTGQFIGFGVHQEVNNFKQFNFTIDGTDGTETPEMEGWPLDRCINIGFALAQPFYLKSMLEEQEEHEHLFLVLLPIYDIWLGSIGYGGLWGALLCTFTEKLLRDNFVLDVLPKLRPRCKALAGELAKSALATITSLPITPPYDLVEHFVKVLIHIQDWERVSVYKGSDKTLQYRYRRFPDCKDSTGKSDAALRYMCDVTWKQCDCKHESPCGDCEQYKSYNNLRTLSWGQRHIWSREIIPELSEEEEARFRDVMLEFDYPETAVVPVTKTDDHRHELFKDAVIDQQIVVLRTLIPKVRARRAALRSAVSAIMGRNMSHNIGSHVLARYSSAIMSDLIPAENGTTDHRTDFLSYLQRRMDFLAEVATSDGAFWSQPLSLKQQFGRLNYAEQKRRFIGKSGTQTTCDKVDCPGKAANKTSPSSSQCSVSHEECTYRLPPAANKEFANEPIVLTFITGKESLLASVEYGKPKAWCDGEDGFCQGGYVIEKQDDVWFACPAGEVGTHALFIILENIIRNSARHGADGDNRVVRVFVEIDQQTSTQDLLKLVIIDPRTRLEQDGRIKDSKHLEEDVRKEKELLKDSQYSLYDDQGKRKKLLWLDGEINSILHDEPFLDEKGIPNPHYWGLREMQICANYLRGIPLSDMEGRRSDLDPVLKAMPKDLLNGSHCLAYELYVQRAKLMAVVTTCETITDVALQENPSKESRDIAQHPEGIRDRLRHRGIAVIPVKGEGASPNTSNADQLREAINASRGYGFLVVTSEIDLPAQVLSDLPFRTHSLSVAKVQSILSQSLQPEDKLAWMEHLHCIEGKRYRTKRTQWMDRNYWGLNAQEIVNPGPEVTEGNWRRVQLDTNETTTDAQGNPIARGMWPLSDQHEGIVAALACEIAAIWIDHPKPGHFTRNDFGQRVCLEQAAMLPQNEFVPVRRWIQVEAVFSDSPHKEALKASNETGCCQELLAAALPRVAVLDERVQSGANMAIRGIRLSNLWPSIGVWVPDKKSCDLDHPELNKIQKFLRMPTIHREQLPIDFLILHLTVLEGLHKGRETHSQTFATTLSNLLTALEEEEEKARKLQVVVVTGRGVPTVTCPDDPDYLQDVRYLPVSAILEYLVARPSKLALMRVLWSAARPASR